MKIESNHLKQQRRGATVIEFLAAGALLATVMTFLAPFVSRVAIVNESISDREFALREVHNLIVEIQSGNETPTLSAEARAKLDSPKLHIDRTLEEESQQQRVAVAVSWVNRAGEQHPPVSLTVWQPVREAD